MTPSQTFSGILRHDPEAWMWALTSVCIGKQQENSLFSQTWAFPDVLASVKPNPRIFLLKVHPIPGIVMQKSPKTGAHPRMIGK